MTTDNFCREKKERLDKKKEKFIFNALIACAKNMYLTSDTYCKCKHRFLYLEYDEKGTIETISHRENKWLCLPSETDFH